ncbi:MAG TPA: choice-of-anchor D domain-containing protein, partial [Candidatus Kapabacteria bacterium]|nr:choice-of-anchor D domain-containing protein [Candidatus Kapabacteria bacterium]
RTGNGGTTWALVSGSLFTPVFSSIALASAQKGVAVGNNAILITSDSGSHWAIDTTLNGTVVLNSVTYADSNTTVAVGNSGVIYRATNGGRTWSAVPSGLTTDLFGVRFANANTGYAVGGYYVSHGINKPSTPYRTVLKTTNGGSTWSTVHSDSGNVLSAVWCIDAQTLFAAGRTDSGWSESIIYSTNGGSTWKTVSDTTQGYDLLSIAFFNADTGLAVGLGGIVLRTTNGGMLWRSVQSGTEAFLYSVAAVQNSSIAAASGSNGTIIFTQDAGATWRNQVSGTSAHLYGIAFADSNIANTAGGTEQDIGEPHGVILRNNHADAPLPRFAKSPAGLNFGNVLLGYQHEDSVIVTNTGASDLYITFDLPTDPTFSVRPGTQIIPPGQPRIFYVTFAPVDTQTRHAYIIFINNATNTGDSVALTGKGYGGSVFASGFGVDFGNVRLGTTARDSVTIYNRGDLPLSLSSITMTDPRFAADETNGTIPPGDSMILHVAYTPTGPNGNGGFAIIKNNSVTSPDSIGFTGTGFTSPLISGDTLNFGRVPLGEYELMRFTLVNNSLLYLNLDSIVSTNPYFVPAPPYKTVYSGQSMVTPVTFTPDSVRSYNGYVIIHYQGVNAPDTIVVLGEGTGPFIAFNKRTLNFGEVLPGNTKTDSVWIHNRGDTTLHISFIYPTESVFTVPVQSMTILPGDSTALQVSFSPLLQQEYSAYLLITSNAASSPDTVVLIGSPASNIRTEPVFPDLYALDQNYPNPFTNTTFFRFSLPQPSNVRMTIDNIFGHTVATLANKQFSGGDHIVAFTANELPAGTYFCNIQAGTWSASRMITLIQ